ncbi:CBM9 family sugar-binding protein [Olleya sp. HaHaR_3_96]|uniref:CBM9 family sugar-binding protein n=1 Tax=Olleya sp. HaHaR_3_96 TaxID=2745560 RepID=UPI001C4E9188|nr:CBM9 family sugar-binding protein [Olleya sp. HaHaR_3_96]QXP59593.1 CBM9 family sugar-binding protein [Olleya sp. HaHaR_3_96]
MKQLFVLLFSIFLFISCKDTKIQHIKPNKESKVVHKTNISPTIDGKATEAIWHASQWYQIDQKWLGEAYSVDDFKGQYKLTWDANALYVLVEIQDDALTTQHKDPLKLWWDNDCVEVFIDEDNSGGEHQYNHNAFAYHIALDGNVVDIAPNNIPTLYNNHVISKRTSVGNTSIWELKINIFDASFVDGKQNNPVVLNPNKKMGFAIAYCDNDTSKTRENFIGSEIIEGEDKNRGWIDASVFGTLILKE